MKHHCEALIVATLAYYHDLLERNFGSKTEFSGFEKLSYSYVTNSTVLGRESAQSKVEPVCA